MYKIINSKGYWLEKSKTSGMEFWTIYTNNKKYSLVGGYIKMKFIELIYKIQGTPEKLKLELIKEV